MKIILSRFFWPRLNMLSMNFINISVNTNEEMSIKDFRQKIYEELKNAVAHTFRLKQGDEYIDEDVEALTSTFDGDEEITLEFTKTEVKTPSKTISRMKKVDIIEYLHEKYDWPKKELKTYNVKELKTTYKTGELLTEERDNRLASRKPRKQTGYMFWSNNGGRDKIKEEHPDLKPQDVMKKCGEVWRQMTEEERATWNAKANPDTVQESTTDEHVQETDEASAPKTSKKKKVIRKKVVRRKKKSTEASGTASE